MLSLRQRIWRLERSPLFQQPLDNPLAPIMRPALRHLSDQDLELLVTVSRDQEVGRYRALSQAESAAVAVYRTALEMEARQMGFKSLAEAERLAGPRP